MKRREEPVCVLTIAGSDSGGGAGIQADIRTIRALGAHPLTAITAVTAQNLHGVAAVMPVPPKVIAAQIRALRADFTIGAVKVGLLPTAAAVRAVARALKRLPGVPVVVDPVLGSTTGKRFLPRSALSALKQELLPLATVVTPNWPEAEALAGCKILSDADAEDAGVKLAQEIPLARGKRDAPSCAVLVKGGHGRKRRLTDVLVAGGDTLHFSASRITTCNTHGTGCILSSAIATALSQGLPLPRAVAKARAHLRRSLKSSRRLAWRARGPA